MSKTDVERTKRKRAASNGDEPKKRRRSSSAESESDDQSARILLMEQGILESKKNYNDITHLLKIMGAFEDGTGSMMAAVALCRVFIRLLAQGAFAYKKAHSEKETAVVGWLKEQLGLYKKTLVLCLDNEDLATTALTLCMRTLKAEGEHIYLGDDYKFPTAFLETIVTVILHSGNEDLIRTLIEEYVEQYDDIRFHTFKAVKAILEAEEGKDVFDATYSLLSALDGVPESEEELEDFYVPKPKKKSHALRSVTQHKRQGQDAWLALLKVSDGKDQLKRVLDIISTVIAPWFNKPELLADYLTNAYSAGGSLSLLALSGVFYLIQERNLDYPSFYHKLYSLLDRDVLHSKHRSRFFRLLDTFLASTHLPASLVASFVKRLSRLSLNAPPSAIVVVVPWIYNLLKKHPTCTFMLHREARDPEAQKHIREHGAEDPFQPEETDPTETQAIDSCLWELVQLQSHYHPNVATIAKIVSEQFTKQSYNMEDFLDHSYASLLDAELGRDVKKTPVVEFHIPKRIFLPQDDPVENPDSLLVKLWDFS
ncbi:hypothetical protein N3K66_007354 [Trichothecium roseum]|uniref:Uncharacterized protein n=1 Tax=Trichothecium roseum TaxID=47278 RepID=A0ACC0UTS2_9HYPO|nr:hypothetical protein N3K66_007354 [Trichothecium roseum]